MGDKPLFPAHPSTRHAGRGLIGEVQEVEAIGHWDARGLLAYSWARNLEQGGGMLMNVLPRFLGQANA